MFIYVYKPGDEPAACMPVSPETTLGEFKKAVAETFVMPTVTLTKNGQALAGDELSLAALGLKQKDLLRIAV